MEEITKLTVERSIWRNGDNAKVLDESTVDIMGPVRLLNRLGFKCCLGFFANQILGIPDKEILERSLPPLDDELFVRGAVQINDKFQTSREGREDALIQHFAKAGYELEFVGEYPDYEKLKKEHESQ